MHTKGNLISIETDVVIIGTGAGGVTAEILTLAGLNVVLIEEGSLKSSRDFRLREAQAYSVLYQESAAREMHDKSINILQGRTVGGSTTLNWTSSIHTPNGTLDYWQKKFGLKDYSSEKLVPWFFMTGKHRKRFIQIIFLTRRRLTSRSATNWRPRHCILCCSSPRCWLRRTACRNDEAKTAVDTHRFGARHGRMHDVR